MCFNPFHFKSPKSTLLLLRLHVICFVILFCKMWAAVLNKPKVGSRLSLSLFSLQDVAATWGTQRNSHLEHFEAGGRESVRSVDSNRLMMRVGLTQSLGGKLRLIVFKRGRNEQGEERETEILCQFLSLKWRKCVIPSGT